MREGRRGERLTAFCVRGEREREIEGGERERGRERER